MNTRIQVKEDNIELEAVMERVSDERAVVVCHPHTLYGGNMHNPVVMTLFNAFTANGFTAVRFNFRGSGASTGSFDDGEGEARDVLAACRMLEDSGIKEIVLAGYSFGSYVNAVAVNLGARIKDHIMASPPVAFMSFDGIRTPSHTGLIVTGESDEIAPPDMVKAQIEKWGISPELHVIPGCDHFYSSGLDTLEEIVSTYLQ